MQKAEGGKGTGAKAGKKHQAALPPSDPSRRGTRGSTQDGVREAEQQKPDATRGTALTAAATAGADSGQGAGAGAGLSTAATSAPEAVLSINDAPLTASEREDYLNLQ